MFCNFVLILALAFEPLWLFLAYRAGKEEKIKISFPNLRKKREMTEEEKKKIREWENILNYDGTRESQEAEDW